ncbi:hypothetical protein bpmyx0001_55380 [Bacillus pseudomycoides DSM 12442]|nr:hypothetical protein bpmyx0001_55380 [Bacillus pseudomycoides DSM 12442]
MSSVATNKLSESNIWMTLSAGIQKKLLNKVYVNKQERQLYLEFLYSG